MEVVWVSAKEGANIMKKDDMKKKVVIKKSNVKGPLFVKKSKSGSVIKKAQSGTGGSKPWASKTPFEKQATRDSIKGSNVARVENIQLRNARAAGFGTEGGGYDKEAYSKHLAKQSKMKDADRYGGGLMVGGAGEKNTESGGPAKAPCKGGGCKANTTGESIFKSGGKVKRKSKPKRKGKAFKR